MYFVNFFQDIEVLFLDIVRLIEFRFLVFDFCDCISDFAIQILIIILLNLRVFDVGYVEIISDDIADFIGLYLQNLESLLFSSQKLVDRGVIIIVSKLKQLKLLDLRNCEISNNGMVRMVLFFINLESLILFFYFKFINVGVKYIVSFVKNFISFDLMDCRGVTNLGVVFLVFNLI